MIGTDEKANAFEIREGEKVYGALSLSLIKGLNGEADRNRNGEITIEELTDFSSRFLSNRSVRQKNRLWKTGGDFVLAGTRKGSGGAVGHTLGSGESALFATELSFQTVTYHRSPRIVSGIPTPTPPTTEQIVRSEIVKQKGAQSPKVRDGKDYALLIATNEYENWNNLANPIRDVEAIATELKDYYGFEIDQPSDILGNPKKADFLNALRRIKARKYSPDDQLFIFVAGHGHYNEARKEGFLIFSDSQALDNNDELCGSCDSYLSHSMLRNVLNGLDCKHIFIVIDACFSGTFDESIRRGSDDPLYENVTNMQMIGRIMQFKTRIFLTSGGKEYVPDGRPGYHSPFAARFLSALRSYGGNFGLVTFNGILSHVERVNPMPRRGQWGDNEPGSDFVFEVKKKP
jgi:hypothetical protein